MKNIRKIMIEAVRSDVPIERDHLIFDDMDKVILRILIFEESFEAIDPYLYWDNDPKRIRKGSRNYIIAILERAENKVKIASIQHLELSKHYHFSLYKIQSFIVYVNSKE